MKPFFSIRLSINLPDTEDDDVVARDEHCIKLTLARNVEHGDDKDDATFEDMDNVTGKLVEAIAWLSSKQPTREQDDFRSYLVSQLLVGYEEHLEQFLESETEVGDADFGDMIRRIAKKCQEANI